MKTRTVPGCSRPLLVHVGTNQLTLLKVRPCPLSNCHARMWLTCQPVNHIRHHHLSLSQKADETGIQSIKITPNHQSSWFQKFIAHFSALYMVQSSKQNGLYFITIKYRHANKASLTTKSQPVSAVTVNYENNFKCLI